MMIKLSNTAIAGVAMLTVRRTMNIASGAIPIPQRPTQRNGIESDGGGGRIGDETGGRMLGSVVAHFQRDANAVIEAMILT